MGEAIPCFGDILCYSSFTFKFLDFYCYIALLGNRGTNFCGILTTITVRSLISFVVVLLVGCANQQPPGGGNEDKYPPKIVYQKPLKNTLNYKGNSIFIEFDEYVDKRSFQDALRISPPFEGEITYQWSGKEVEVVLPYLIDGKESKKTYVVSIGSGLQDIHGNSLKQPVQFAFSTGSTIDKAGISGRVANNDGKVISILAYRLTLGESDYNPAKNIANYITETDSAGLYTLTNLSPGIYRVIAVFDDDKNLLYTSEREDYGVLRDDITLKDSLVIGNVNFFIRQLKQEAENKNKLDPAGFYKDSLSLVYTSIEDNSKNVLPDESIFFVFNKVKPSRVDIINSFRMKDENNSDGKVVFNWHNDTLLEIFAPGKFGLSKTYRIAFNITLGKDSIYNYVLKFKTPSTNSFGEITGIVKRSGNAAVIAELISNDEKRKLKYTNSIIDSVFVFKGILEGEYSLFSFVDRNMDGIYDYGNPFPFAYSELFFLYPREIDVKGGWAVENVIIDFSEH